MISNCTHDVEHLVGTADGITCKNCGKTFSTFAELVADRPKLKKEQVEEVAEKPKKSTKKGAK